MRDDDDTSPSPPRRLTPDELESESKAARADRHHQERRWDTQQSQRARDAERRRQALDDQRARDAREDRRRADDAIRRRYEVAAQAYAADRSAGQALTQQAMGLATEQPLVGIPVAAAVAWMAHRRTRAGQQVMARWVEIRRERGLAGSPGEVLNSAEAEAVATTADEIGVALSTTPEGEVVAAQRSAVAVTRSDTSALEDALDRGFATPPPPTAASGLVAEPRLMDQLATQDIKPDKDIGLSL